MLIELTFSGEKNAAPKFATATVDVTQTNHSGQASVTHKGFTHFVFGPDGLEHKAFLLEDATCGPLKVDVRANKTAEVAEPAVPLRRRSDEAGALTFCQKSHCRSPSRHA